MGWSVWVSPRENCSIPWLCSWIVHFGGSLLWHREDVHIACGGVHTIMRNWHLLLTYSQQPWLLTSAIWECRFSNRSPCTSQGLREEATFSLAGASWTTLRQSSSTKPTLILNHTHCEIMFETIKLHKWRYTEDIKIKDTVLALDIHIQE